MVVPEPAVAAVGDDGSVADAHVVAVIDAVVDDAPAVAAAFVAAARGLADVAVADEIAAVAVAVDVELVAAVLVDGLQPQYRCCQTPPLALEVLVRQHWCFLCRYR